MLSAKCFAFSIPFLSILELVAGLSCIFSNLASGFRYHCRKQYHPASKGIASCGPIYGFVGHFCEVTAYRPWTTSSCWLEHPVCAVFFCFPVSYGCFETTDLSDCLCHLWIHRTLSPAPACNHFRSAFNQVEK